MTATTCIRNIAWLIAWDAREGRHTYRRDVDLAFEGGDLTFQALPLRVQVHHAFERQEDLHLPGHQRDRLRRRLLAVREHP